MQILKSTTVPLTRELAEEMKNMKPSPTERVLNANRVAFLRQKVEENMWVSAQWAKAKFNGEYLRMNGQHSSEMLCTLPDELFPKGSFVHMDEYQVEDFEGLALLFQQFDAQKSSRNAEDVAGAYKGLHRELDEVPVKLAKLGIDGIAWYKAQLLGMPVPKGHQRYELLNQENLWPFLLYIPEIFNMKTPEMRNPYVVAAMHATHEKNQVAAEEFWRLVAIGGDASTENHPTKTLDDWLQSVKLETDTAKKPKPYQIYQGCIQAWNAYRQDKPLATITKRKAKTEIEVSE